MRLPLVIVATLAPLAGVAYAEPAASRGFTAELELGGSKTTFEGKAPRNQLDTYNGYALRAGLGWFVTHDIALGVRASRDGNFSGFRSSMIAIDLQYMWSERAWFAFLAGPHVSQLSDKPDDVGVGVGWRVGYTLPSAWSDRHLWNVSIDTLLIDPISHARGALSAALLLGYQFR